MPEDFEGDQSILPFLLATAPIGVYAWNKRDAIRTAMGQTGVDPISQVVGGQAREWFAGMGTWTPNVAAIDPGLHDPILQAFKRRVGTSTGMGGVTTLQGAVEATQGSAALKSILRQSIREFKGVDPTTIGGPIGLGRNIPLTTTRPRAVTNVGAISEALASNDLGLSRGQRASLRAHLDELAAVTRDMMDTVPTFQLRRAGDRTISEMVVNLHRAGGPVNITIPLPGATGAVTTEFGTRYYARKILADVPEFLTTGVAREATAGEFALQRLRELVTTQQGAISQRDLNRLQREIRKQLIYTGDERGVLPSRSVGRTYAQQMAVPRYRIGEAWNVSGAQYEKALERLAGMGRAAGLTPDAIAKGLVWTEAGAAALPHGGVTPQHFTQAMTKAGRGAPAQLFQISPAAAEMAGRQLGMQAITPGQDVIMMAQGMKGALKTGINRPITIDPELAASRRFTKIQQLLNDNATTRAMLDGGATLEETMGAYMRLGSVEKQRMGELRTVKEGEFLGMTKSGPKFAKTYGMETQIRDFRTVGGMTKVTLSGYYDPQKVFSTGGVKHSLEYAHASSIKQLGIRAKALEILRARGLDPSAVEPGVLRGAEQEAAKMYGGAMGVIVEGAGWSPWEKWRGAGKNVGRFNKMIEERWTSQFGELPAGYWQTEDLMGRRKILMREARARGINWFENFSPITLATRQEYLKPGPAAEMLGIGRPGTFTDDAFRIFRTFGWNDIATDMAKRVERDVPLQRLLEQAVTATRGEGVGMALEEVMRRPGGLEALLGDAGARAAFMEEAGGIIQLPQTYKVAGKEISQIGVPFMGTGYTGYFTTPEGKEIVRDLDRSLRNVLTSAQTDIGVTGVAASEMAAAAPLEKYYDDLARIATKHRDKVGGRVQGSLTFAIGREIAEDVTLATGQRAPFAAIAKETFEDWVAENLRTGMIDQSMAREQRRLFRMGRLPIKAIKHPARGPLSAGIFYLGAAPEAAELGWAAEKNFAYLSESLLKPFLADLDFDPMPLDMFTNRAALKEASRALESGQVTQLIQRHEMLSEKLGVGLKRGAGKEGVRAWFQDMWDTQFLKDRAARDAASKSEVGIFTSRVAWPMAAAAEEAGLSMEQKFDAMFWAEIMEEKTTLKARHDMNIAAGQAEELAQAFQSGRHKILQDRTREVLGLKTGEEAYFDDLLERLSSTWKNMSHDTRAQMEAKFAGRGAARAKTFMQLAAGDTIASTHAGIRGSTGMAGQTVRTFEKLGNVMRGHKKGLLMAAGAAALAGFVMARPRDLTPESVEGGKVAGGPSGNVQRLPMPRLGKNIYYNKGSVPGFKVQLNLSKEIDHKTLADQLSRITGDSPVNVQINDSRRQVTRHDIEREMHSNRLLGALTPGTSFYNSSRYQ
jgi:hypothetical protein